MVHHRLGSGRGLWSQILPSPFSQPAPAARTVPSGSRGGGVLPTLAGRRGHGPTVKSTASPVDWRTGRTSVNCWKRWHATSTKTGDSPRAKHLRAVISAAMMPCQIRRRARNRPRPALCASAADRSAWPRASASGGSRRSRPSGPAGQLRQMSQLRRGPDGRSLSDTPATSAIRRRLQPLRRNMTTTSDRCFGVRCRRARFRARTWATLSSSERPARTIRG